MWQYSYKIKIIPNIIININTQGINIKVGSLQGKININIINDQPSIGLIPDTKFYNYHSNSILINKNYINRLYRTHKPKKESLSLSNSSSINYKDKQIDILDIAHVITNTTQEKERLNRNINQIYKELAKTTDSLFLSRVFIFGLFFNISSNLKKDILKQKSIIRILEKSFKHYNLKINFILDKKTDITFLDLQNSFIKMTNSNSIWNVIEEIKNPIGEKSAASFNITRIPVVFSIKNLEPICGNYSSMCFKNPYGLEIFLYPAFVIIRSLNYFNLIKINELKLSFKKYNFIERDYIPPDAEIIDITWEKVNKDGNPDRRFKNNSEIPVALYGLLIFSSTAGLHEKFIISNVGSAEKFFYLFHKYKKITE